MPNEACVFNPDAPRGNMYFKGTWDFCTEYNTGETVIFNGVLYMALEHQAGYDPSKKENRKYWVPFSIPGKEKKHYGIEDIDGGYASTDEPEIFDDDDLIHVLDGGSASERQFIPLTD